MPAGWRTRGCRRCSAQSGEEHRDDGADAALATAHRAGARGERAPGAGHALLRGGGLLLGELTRTSSMSSALGPR